MRGHQCRDELLADYCDGTACKSRPLFSDDCQALQIMAYYDDVEVCNPLGSGAKKHKQGKCECACLNIHMYKIFSCLCMTIMLHLCIVFCSPFLLSAWEYFSSIPLNVQLLAVTKSSVRLEYGADCILENAMKAVKQLEQASILKSDHCY